MRGRTRWWWIKKRRAESEPAIGQQSIIHSNKKFSLSTQSGERKLTENWAHTPGFRSTQAPDTTEKTAPVCFISSTEEKCVHDNIQGVEASRGKTKEKNWIKKFFVWFEYEMCLLCKDGWGELAVGGEVVWGAPEPKREKMCLPFIMSTAQRNCIKARSRGLTLALPYTCWQHCPSRDSHSPRRYHNFMGCQLKFYSLRGRCSNECGFRIVEKCQ